MDTMTFVRFLLAAVLLTVFIALSFNDAIATGWFWKLSSAMKIRRAADLSPGTTHFFEVGSHWGFWAAIPLNVLLAWAYAQSVQRWNGQLLSVVVIVSSLIAVFAMRSWAIADDDPNVAKHVLSGFALNGNFTVSGLCLTFTMTFTYTIAVMYFLTVGPTDSWFPLIFAIALTLALLAGLLQPPIYVWGEIHSAAWTQSAVFTVLVWALYLAHHRGYVIST
jgi:hypothetical protein